MRSWLGPVQGQALCHKPWDEAEWFRESQHKEESMRSTAVSEGEGSELVIAAQPNDRQELAPAPNKITGGVR